MVLFMVLHGKVWDEGMEMNLMREKKDIVEINNVDIVNVTKTDTVVETKPDASPKSKSLIIKLDDLVPFKDHPFAYASRRKPWESLWGSSATTPLVDFHHRPTACPSY